MNPLHAAEAAVLGAAILSTSARQGVLDLLDADAFEVEAHRTIFETLTAMHTDGDHIDQVTVTMRLANDGRIDEIGGHTGVFQLTDPIACPAPSAWRSYALIVADAADRRRLDLQLRRGLAQLADGAAPQAIRNQIAAA